MEIIQVSDREAVTFVSTTEPEARLLKRFQTSLWVGSLGMGQRPIVLQSPEEGQSVRCIVPLPRTAAQLKKLLE